MVTETGKLLTRMAHGEIFHCHILVFVPPSPITYQRESIRVECVEEKRIPETLEKLSDNRYGYRELTRCRSPPIFLKDGERIRINLNGGIKLPEGFQKDQMIITFLREGLHKHVVFPAVTKFGNRPSPWAYLNFNRSDGKTIYETFFDAEFPFRKEKQKADYGASFESLPYLANRSRAVSALDINETGKTIPFSRPVSAPSDQSSRSPSIIDKTVLVLTELLSPKEWKFVLREIIDEKKEVNPDSIIEEAVANNKSDVKEAIYQSLKSWTHMYMSSCTQNQKVDEIIQRLQKKYQGIAIELEKKVKTNQAKM
ncbi:uncharacterized protein LOC132549617 [Ylistrum balloti]|uniref:uncharacterized protein LOC132549617 n=1 Tax=Ylistrum balloti TaxID=509963 RepID=UPI002905D4B4|nr:uncharacterized protein LOC132549617 [Ylistrum balloti]